MKGSRQVMGPAWQWPSECWAEGSRVGAESRWSPQAELQQKVEENEHLRLELQMVETERVRLSLLEEKLVDVLQLLQRLRALVGARAWARPGQGEELSLRREHWPVSGIWLGALLTLGRCHPHFKEAEKEAQGSYIKKKGMLLCPAQGDIIHFIKLI